MRRLVTATFLLSLWPMASWTEAQERLPAPRAVAAPVVVVLPYQPRPFPPHAGYRVSQYQIWDNYAVDSYGYFQPRVIVAPSGAYYRYNGAPYRWTTTQPQAWMPNVSE